MNVFGIDLDWESALMIVSLALSWYGWWWVGYNTGACRAVNDCMRIINDGRTAHGLEPFDWDEE